MTQQPKRVERPVFKHDYIRVGHLRFEQDNERRGGLKVRDTAIPSPSSASGLLLAGLDANDAIRLAAWLNRWFRDYDEAVKAGENRAAKANRDRRAAKAAAKTEEN